MEENLVSKLNEIVEDNAKVLVGIMSKRVEVLEREKCLSPNLFKSLIKEIIYENSRYLKKLLNIELDRGTIVFKTKSPEE